MMKKLISSIVFLCSVLLSHAQIPLNMEYAVLPTPAEMKCGTELWQVPDTLHISGSFGSTHIKLTDTEVNLYHSILKREVSKDGGYGIYFSVDPSLAEKYKTKEYYEIIIKESGVVVSIVSRDALVPALQTIKQLLIYQEGKVYLPHCTIKDYPDSPWRGLLLDVSRHFMPLDVLYRTIDGMSACKMNVLHLHLSDDQAFRIECKTFPLLHQKGSNGQYYTQEEIKKLIKYAADRGIQIVPEFDIPGHTTAWLSAYPEYASLTIPAKPEIGYGIFKPVMNPANEKLYKHLDLFFKEMSTLFPGEYMHIGGDEVRSDDWLNNPAIKKFMDKKGYTTVPQLQNYFNARVEKLLLKYKKKIIGWDEILEGKPSKGTIIQSWRGEQYQRDAIAQGYGVIRSNGFYLDQTYTAGEYYARFDTLNSPLYLGGEAAMWSELVDSVTIDSRLWPNTAAIAEIYWRHPKQVDSISFYKKLLVFMTMNGVVLRNESYEGYLLQKREENTELPSPVYSYITPLDGYRRHKIIKTDMAYNTFYQLYTYADLGRPTSGAYIIFTLTLNQYIENPTEENRGLLQVYFSQWISMIDTEGDSPATGKSKEELHLILLAMKMCGEAGELWLGGKITKAQDKLAEAKALLAGKEYELNVFSLLEKAMK